MARIPSFVVMLTMLSSLASAQIGQISGSGGVSDPFSGFDTTVAAGTGWRPWLSVNGNYSRVISSSEQSPYLRPPNGGISGGIGGYKQWATKRLAGGYTGNVSYNPTSSRGFPKWRPSQSANLSYSQQLNERLRVSISQMGGITYGGYGVGSGFGVNGVPGVSNSYGAGGGGSGNDSASGAFGDPSVNGIVDNEIFSSKSKFYGTSGSVSYLLSERVSVTGFGSASFARRDQGIRKVNSYSGGGQANYRLTGQSTIGAGSSYFSSRYPGFFGTAYGANYFATFGHQLNATTQITAQVGAANMMSEFIGKVALPPELAALLGVSTSMEVTRMSFWAPTFGFGLQKSFEVGSFSARVGRGTSMGNGVTLSGMRDMATIAFGRPLTKKLGASLTTSYVRSSGRVGVQAVSETVQAGASLSYALGGGFGTGVQTGMRYLSIPGFSRRSDIFVGGGIHWSPGDRPFIY